MIQTDEDGGGNGARPIASRGAGKRDSMNCKSVSSMAPMENKSCDHMDRLPVLAECSDDGGIQIGVQGRLRKTEIDVGQFAARDLLSGDQVIAFVPDKGPE